MNKSTLVFSDYDVERLEDILDGYRFTKSKRSSLNALAEELGKGKVVVASNVPPDVVTLNSRIILRDLDKNTQIEVTLVLPTNADFTAGRLSVLSPVGTAVLGYAVGDEIKWQVQAGFKRLRIEQILYQPESAGDFHL
jgi:regulator of nucleoside diphosphate kinase